MSMHHSSDHGPGPNAKPWQNWAILGCAIISLIFGTWGYMIYAKEAHEEVNISNAFYHAIQLFKMDSPHLVHHVPLELQIARWVAAATTVWAGIRFFGRIIGEWFAGRRLRKMEKHTIVCGLGRKGLAIVRHLHHRGENMVAIDSAPTPEAVAECRHLHIHLLTGDATRPEILKAAGVARAGRLVAVCGSDSVDCEIAANVCQVTDKNRLPALHCRVEVGDIETRKNLQTMLTQSGAISGVSLHFFDCLDREACKLIVRGLPLDYRPILAHDTRQVHLVILGLGRMGRAFIVRAAQLGIYANGKPLKISVVDSQAYKRTSELLFRYPKIGELCQIEPHEEEVLSPGVWDLLKQWCEDPSTLTTVAICLGENPSVLDIALRLHSLDANMPVAVWMSGKSGITKLLNDSTVGGKLLRPFGMENEIEKNGALGDDADELFAKRIHAAYRHMRELEAEGDAAKLKKLESDPAMKPWDQLGVTFRESNRQQHFHHYIKMRAVDCAIVDEDHDCKGIAEFTPEEVETLAEMEHDRWMAEKLVEGWVHAPGDKNEDLRTNPWLLHWSSPDLPEKIKNYDRQAVHLIPKVIAATGRKICRNADLEKHRALSGEEERPGHA